MPVPPMSRSGAVPREMAPKASLVSLAGGWGAGGSGWEGAMPDNLHAEQTPFRKGSQTLFSHKAGDNSADLEGDCLGIK